MQDRPPSTEDVVQGTLSQVSTAAVAIVVMLYIVGEILESIPAALTDQLAATQDTVLSTFASTMELAGVALIIMVAGMILWVVRGFGAPPPQ